MMKAWLGVALTATVFTYQAVPTGAQVPGADVDAAEARQGPGNTGLSGVPSWAEAAEVQEVDVMNMPRPIEARDSVWLEELTALEVRDALEAGKTTAIVITAGLEENGPYLGLGKHNWASKVTVELIARKLGDALIAPIITYEPGDPNDEEITPGAPVISLPTYQAYLADIATSLRSGGFRNILMMADSGGNARPMQEVTRLLNEQWKREGATVWYIPEYYSWSDTLQYQVDVLGIQETRYSEGYHDNYYTEAMIMVEDPRHVRLYQRIKANKASINGISILPAEETIAHGKKLVEFRADRAVSGVRKALANGDPADFCHGTGTATAYGGYIRCQ